MQSGDRGFPGDAVEEARDGRNSPQHYERGQEQERRPRQQDSAKAGPMHVADGWRGLLAGKQSESLGLPDFAEEERQEQKRADASQNVHQRRV